MHERLNVSKNFSRDPLVEFFICSFMKFKTVKRVKNKNFFGLQHEEKTFIVFFLLYFSHHIFPIEKK